MELLKLALLFGNITNCCHKMGNSVLFIHNGGDTPLQGQSRTLFMIATGCTTINFAPLQTDTNRLPIHLVFTGTARKLMDCFLLGIAGNARKSVIGKEDGG